MQLPQTTCNTIKLKCQGVTLMIKIIAVLICLVLPLTAAGQNKIYNCVIKGKTLYSESPCKENAYNENVFEVTNERLGTVAPSAETIDAANARIKRRSQEIDAETLRYAQSPNQRSEKKSVCDAAKIEADQLDAWARQPNTGWTQDQIRSRKQTVQKTAFEWKC